MESIQAGLSARFEGEGSWAEVEASCARAGTPALRTMQRWCKSYAEQAPSWLGVVQATRCNRDILLGLGEIGREKRTKAGGLHHGW